MVRLLLPAALALCLAASFIAEAGARMATPACGATTQSATDVTATSATLNAILGDADLGGDAANCGATYDFDYGTPMTYGSTTLSNPPGMGQNVPVSASVFNLTPDTTYHFRVDAASGPTNSGIGEDVTFHTLQGADLSLTDVVDHPIVLPGANVTFTIVITNHGPADATNVNLTDTPPAGLIYNTITPSDGSCFQSSEVICSLESIPNGTSVTITIVASTTIRESVADQPEVTATNTPNAVDASAAVKVETASVSLTDSASPSPVVAGSTTTFTISLANSGPDAADGVSVSDSLPAGLSFVSATPSSGSCSGTSTVTCSLGPVANGGHGSVTIVVGTSGTGSFTDNASATGPDIAPESTTTASAGITVQAAAPPPPPPPPPQLAKLALSNTASATALRPGSNVSFAIVVSSLGPADATGVAVSDTLPSGLTLLSATAPGGGCSGTTTITCALGTITNGTSATVTIVAAIGAAGSYDNNATATASNLDSSTPPSATASITVAAAAACCAPIGPTQPVTTPNVLVNDSIDGVSIGETEKEVEKKLGTPGSTLSLGLGGGKKGKLARYKVGGQLFIVTYDENGKVVSLETYSSTFRTSAGLGPGSSLAKVAALRGFHVDYCELGYWNGTTHTKPGSVVTVFTPNGGFVASVLITQLRFYTACATGSQEQPPAPTLSFNRSLGSVSIGMTEKTVLEALGEPLGALKITLGGGKSGTSVRYSVHGAPLLITYDSTGKVISIEAYSPYFKTIGGIGPGSSLSLVRALRGFRPDFCELGYWNGTAHTRPSRIVTVFTPNGAVVASVLITQLQLYTACATGSRESPPT